MSETLTVEELDAQIAQRNQRFKQVIADIRAALEHDLPQFVARETKRAFLGHPDVAERLGPQRIKDLKERSAALGPDLASRVSTALMDEALWHAETTVPANTRDISSASAVWAEVQHVETELHSLLDEFGLAEAEPPRYKAPAYFINGLYLPGLAEHFWRLMHEVEELRAQREKIQRDEVRARLEAMWDEA